MVNLAGHHLSFALFDDALIGKCIAHTSAWAFCYAGLSERTPLHYEDKKGEATLYNLEIVNLFADLGIYDYTTYLFLDFYKGTPTLYLQYFYSKEALEIELSGYSTVEIIYEIFVRTIFSDMRTRRRI